MRSLPSTFLQKLAAHLETENTLGIALSGSFARGDGGTYSDIDLWHYLREEAAGEIEPYLEFMDGYLVSIKTTLVDKDYAGMRNPKRAIWVVPALRHARILLDRSGAVAALFEAARNFTWESIRAEADTFASHTVAGTAEETYKILDGLTKKNESKTAYAIWSLTQNLADALLVQRGVLIPTENVYIDHAQAEAGRSSEWTRQFRMALGLDPLPAGQPAYICYGIAGLRLYRETARLLKNHLLPEDACVVDQTLEIIQEAGYS